MRSKIDESLPIEVGALLRKEGHDAHSVKDEGLCGAPDNAVAKICKDERRILVTLDLDFAHIRNFPPQDYEGIIVLRLNRQDRDSVLTIIPRILALLKIEPVTQKLWIADEKRTRIRGATEQ